jgi:hypothetical protein
MEVLNSCCRLHYVMLDPNKKILKQGFHNGQRSLFKSSMLKISSNKPPSLILEVHIKLLFKTYRTLIGKKRQKRQIISKKSSKITLRCIRPRLVSFVN